MNKSVKTLILLCILPLSLLAAYMIRKSCDQISPVPNVMKLFDVKVMEDHKEALDHWIKKGFRDAVLVSIDAHDDIQMLSTEKMNRLKDVYQKTVRSGVSDNNFMEIESTLPLVTNGNFINAAVKLGIIKKVVWIVPSTYRLLQGNRIQLESLLKTYGFPDKDIDTFQMKNGCFSGIAFEVPLDICDVNTLPYLNEPVLLSIDVDFFPPSVTDYDHNIAKSVKHMVKALFNNGYTIRDTVVAYSVNGGFLSTNHRWVGDLTVDLLRSPEMRAQPELTKKYSVLQTADLLLSMHRYKDLLDYLLPYLKGDEENPAITMYVAKAYYELGEIDKSFAYAKKVCIAENNYCYGLPEIGSSVMNDHGLESSARFFIHGYEMCPKMDYSQFRFALNLKESGRYNEAIKYFKIFKKFHGPFPTDFYIAEAYLLKGDESSAMQYFDSGKSALLKDPSALTSFGDPKVIKKAVRFYKENDLKHFAEELINIMEYTPANEIKLGMQ